MLLREGILFAYRVGDVILDANLASFVVRVSNKIMVVKILVA